MAEGHRGQGTRPAGPRFEFWLEGSEPGDLLVAGDAVTGPPASRPGPGAPGGGRHRARGRTVLPVAGAVTIAVAVTLVAVLGPASSKGAGTGHGPARHTVLAALSATIASGSFAMAYSEQPVTPPTTGGSQSPYGGGDGVALSGQGVIDTNPFAMVATSQVPGVGEVTARADGTDVWESGGADYGLSPGSTSAGPGSPLDGFAPVVESTLGARQGALSMMGLASPTGYLELDQDAITSAEQAGTGTVDGTPVTEFTVFLDPDAQADPPGATDVEASAIGAALAQLAAQGYRGTTVKVAIDGAGYIRQTVSTASFADGATQITQVTFSDFGCAGTVLMPGQSGASAPPPGCTSPDG